MKRALARLPFDRQAAKNCYVQSRIIIAWILEKASLKNQDKEV